MAWGLHHRRICWNRNLQLVIIRLLRWTGAWFPMARRLLVEERRMITAGLADRLKEYYVGKICSIITRPFAWSVGAEDYPTWFTLRIDDLDQEVVLGTDLHRGTKHVFFFGPQLIGIAEEQVIPPNHPDYEKIKKKAEAIKQQASPPPLPILPPCSTIDKVAQQASELKKKWASPASKKNEP